MRTKDGLWKLSPSGLYCFDQCQACFWLENHYGRPPMIPFVLNSAMDTVLKTRYDLYRGKGELPPEINTLTLEGVKPFTDLEVLNDLRSKAYTLAIRDAAVGYELVGKLDEIMLEKDGRLIPADFKSSGYMPKEDKQKYYVSQLNAYALMLHTAGYALSDRALLLHYYITNVRNSSLSVEFSAHIDPVKLDLPVFEEKLAAMVRVLNLPYPGENPDCPTCGYYKGRQSAIL